MLLCFFAFFILMCINLFDIFLIRYVYCIAWRDNHTHWGTHMAWTGPTVGRPLTTRVLDVIPIGGCPSKVLPILLTFSSPSDWTTVVVPTRVLRATKHRSSSGSAFVHRLVYLTRHCPIVWIWWMNGFQGPSRWPPLFTISSEPSNPIFIGPTTYLFI